MTSNSYQGLIIARHSGSTRIASFTRGAGRLNLERRIDAALSAGVRAAWHGMSPPRSVHPEVWAPGGVIRLAGDTAPKPSPAKVSRCFGGE
jgi:CelD/BcsL family acetyltransferase involved in cellulose biosynthesis